MRQFLSPIPQKSLSTEQFKYPEECLILILNDYNCASQPVESSQNKESSLKLVNIIFLNLLILKYRVEIFFHCQEALDSD